MWSICSLTWLIMCGFVCTQIGLHILEVKYEVWHEKP